MSPWTGEAAHLADRIVAYVDAALADMAEPEPFGDLALAIHRWQRAHDPVLAALTEHDPTEWTDIPSVPVGLFKDLPVGTVPPERAAITFRTSGTTGAGRGEHRLRSPVLYERGALGFAKKVLTPLQPLTGRVVALLGDPRATPDSSLSHMVSLFPAFSGDGTSSWYVHDGVLNREGLDAAIRAATGPVFVASTAFALAEWLDHDVPRLPSGSWLMVTGGFKGRRVRLDDAGLYAEAAARLVPGRIVTEYGMTELSSQLWGIPGESFRAPRWLRVVAVDPHLGTPLPAETPGQLRFYDLCNLDGTLAIETLDEGVVHADGTVTLHGRLAGAEARGCSLTIEEAWERRRALDARG